MLIEEETEEENEPIDELQLGFGRSLAAPSIPSLLSPGSIWTATDGSIIAKLVFRAAFGKSVAGDAYMRANPSQAVYFDGEIVDAFCAGEFLHAEIPQPEESSKAQIWLAVSLTSGHKMTIGVTLSDRVRLLRRHSAPSSEAPARGLLARRYSTALTGTSHPLPAINLRDEAEASVYPDIFPLPTSSTGSRRKKASHSAITERSAPTTSAKNRPCMPMLESVSYTGPMMHATINGFYEGADQATCVSFHLKYAGDGSNRLGYSQYSKDSVCTFGIL